VNPMAIFFSPLFWLVGLLLFSPFGAQACASDPASSIGCEAANQPCLSGRPWWLWQTRPRRGAGFTRGEFGAVQQALR